jgi:hypothetical protein
MEKINFHESLIRDYLAERNSSCWMDFVVKYTRKQKTLEEAIRIAVKSRDENGKKHPHQWRIYNYVYGNFIQNLLNVKEKIKGAKDFDELYNITNSNRPTGAGELFCYDTALRMGHFLNKLPKKIYIHAGTRIGLKALLGREIYEKTMYKKDLPEPFCSCELTSDQLEDFFCIYKNLLSGNSNNKKSFCSK